MLEMSLSKENKFASPTLRFFFQNHCVSFSDLYGNSIELRKLHPEEKYLWRPKLVDISSWQKERLQYLSNQEIESS